MLIIKCNKLDMEYKKDKSNETLQRNWTHIFLSKETGQKYESLFFHCNCPLKLQSPAKIIKITILSFSYLPKHLN